MDYQKTSEILQILSDNGYSLYDLACAIEEATKSGVLPEVKKDDQNQ